jgi:hypothetical protein
LHDSLKLFWQDKKIFTRVLLAVYFTLGLIGILHHSMWRDELNGWLIARDSQSLADFWDNIKYEGHPLLWYLCLALLNQLTSNPVAMQIFHLFLATGAAYLFIRFSPFKPIEKLLFTFGYLPFYEYLVISRNYAIGLLFVFLFCTLFGTRRKTYLWLAFVLALMANSNAYCLLISLALALMLVVEYRFRREFAAELEASLNNALASLFLYASGAIASIITLLPPADSQLQGGVTQWMFQFDVLRLARTLNRIWNSYILVITPSHSRLLDQSIFVVFSLFILALAIALFIKKPFILLFYLIGTLEILLFTYIKFLGSPRHYGQIYIVFITSLWLASYYPNSFSILNLLTNLSPKFQYLLERWLRFVARHKTTFIMAILSAQLVAGILGFIRDLTVPYSASRETAQFIKTHQLDSLLIVGSEDFAISPLCGYLDRKIYYPEIRQLGSFVLFNRKRAIADDREVLAQVSELVKEKNTKILLILNHELDGSRDDLLITTVAKFPRAFIYNEKYYLYSISRLDKVKIP